MTTLRRLLCIVTMLALAVGYFASQWFYFAGDPSGYARAVDVAPVRWLALALLAAAVVLAFVPDKPSSEEPR